jgi:O-methyltransferase
MLFLGKFELVLDDMPVNMPRTSLSKAKRANLAHLLLCVLGGRVAGDVVECGSYLGHTACLLKYVLLSNRSHKKLHVYDSFAGLPELGLEDKPTCLRDGGLKASLDVFKDTFAKNGLWLPVIHDGWFENTMAQLPPKICFAHFDGDLYGSMISCFEGVYPRMETGAIGVIDDYGWKRTVGVKKACDEFFADKEDLCEMIVEQGDSAHVFFVKC